MRILLASLIVLVFTACTTSPIQKAQEPGTVSVMAYNVENLFDTIKDENREDHTYLPLTKKDSIAHKRACMKISSTFYRKDCLEEDWNQEVLKRKMERIADVILQVNNGRGPDLLILEEVENLRVLKQLNEGYLQDADYESVILLEGPDKRGIDVAFLSRLPQMGDAELHKIPYRPRTKDDAIWMARSRGILQATFRLPDGQPLTAFALHFPSPRNPTYWREQAINHLIHLKKQVPKDHLVIAGGDFNIASHEERRVGFYKNKISQHFQVSHLIGCRECRGTNYYHSKREWSFLDALVFDKKMKPNGSGNWYVDPKSVAIANKSRYQTNKWLSPARFKANGAVGVSDHWPIMAVLKRQKPLTAAVTQVNVDKSESPED